MRARFSQTKLKSIIKDDPKHKNQAYARNKNKSKINENLRANFWITLAYSPAGIFTLNCKHFKSASSNSLIRDSVKEDNPAV